MKSGMARLSEQRDRYQEQGCLLLRGILSDRELDPVRQRIGETVDDLARRLLSEGRISALHADVPFDRRLAEIGRETELRVPIWNREVFGKAIYDLLTTPALLDLTEALLGPEVSVNGDYWVRPKLPQAQRTTYPWHQDSGYYGAQTAGSHILSVWIPLVDVDEQNGCMQCLPGSHRWGLLPTQSNEFGHNYPVEDVEARGEVVTLQMKAGDLFLFHNLLFHRSLMNQSDHVRWSIDLRYSATGTDVAWLNKLGYYGFVARSKANPGAVESWEQWQAKWADEPIRQVQG
jgi:hypothetical protein